MNPIEAVEHLTKVSGGAVEILPGIETVADAQLASRIRHELPKTACARFADGQGIVTRFDPDQRIQQA